MLQFIYFELSNMCHILIYERGDSSTVQQRANIQLIVANSTLDHLTSILRSSCSCSFRSLIFLLLSLGSPTIIFIPTGILPFLMLAELRFAI